MKDLHIHTSYSDGEYNEKQIIEEIKKTNITEFAICDHDTLEGSKKVYEELNKNSENLIFHTGVELSCRLNEYKNGVNMHILVHDFDFEDEKMLKIVDKISLLRKQKISRMVDFVENHYKIKIPQDKLEEKIKSTNSFGKPHLYSILCTLGNYNRKEYYKLMDTLNTADLKLDSVSTLTTLNKSGKLILAHPIEIMEEYNFTIKEIEEIIEILVKYGLTGIETHHSSQTKELQTKLIEIAKKYSLITSQGSDFHGPNVKPNLKIGQIEKES